MPEHTENELRAALLTRAPTDLDVSDFRARLDRALADPSPSAQAEAHAQPDDAAVVIAIEQAPRVRRSARSRAGLAITIAACVAAIVALVIALLPDPVDHQATTDGVPDDVRSFLLPGTIVVGTYRGTGSRDIELPQRTVPEYYHYNSYTTCSTGTVTVFAGAPGSRCNGTENILSGYSSGPEGSPVQGVAHLRAGRDTTWETTIVIEPETRTNAGVQFPVNPGLSGPDTAYRRTGTGSATARLTRGDGTGESYYLDLVCTGSGVSLPDLTSELAPHGLVTRTCLAGREYSWQDVKITLPVDVRVIASPGTRWTILLERQ